MKLMYLGTAAAEGAPAIFCNCDHCRYAREKGGREIRMRSGAMIDGALKLDFSGDAYAQALRFGLSYAGLSDILITHSHEDHFCPEDLSRVTAPDAHGRGPLTVWGDEKVGKRLAPYVERKKGMLVFRLIRPFETQLISGYAVTALPAIHCWGGDEKPLMYLIEKDNCSLLYAHDTDEFPEEVMAFLAGRRIDLISLDCTNGVLDLDYIGHMGISDNLRLKEALLACSAAGERTVFVANHFSHNGLVPHEELERRLPGFLVSYDGMEVEI